MTMAATDIQEVLGIVPGEVLRAAEGAAHTLRAPAP